ncbi:hypothetical protein ONR57_12410 [Hoyosella sp. YIM 151337]|nr:hypothetical protein [Hoyosella sp. YIM 151337]MCW4354103.1 hypothetical protein [Hoyosella sp. YIM 151337]
MRSLTNGIVDTIIAHGKFGMFALMAEYKAALIKERTGRVGCCACPRT